MMDAAKILLADDDPEDRMIMAESFSEMELTHWIHFVENGEKVLTYLDDIIADEFLPTLVVLDLNMPRMNGTQTLKALKNNPRYKHIPVIIFSTSVNTIEMQECLKIGAMSYVVKPVTYRDCLDTAKSFYDTSAGINSKSGNSAAS
ncbi:MAG: response regulator [Bacteroidota bacterium]